MNQRPREWGPFPEVAASWLRGNLHQECFLFIHFWCVQGPAACASLNRERGICADPSFPLPLRPFQARLKGGMPRFHKILKGAKRLSALGRYIQRFAWGNMLRRDCQQLWPILLTRWPTNQFSYLNLSETPPKIELLCMSIWGSL